MKDSKWILLQFLLPPALILGMFGVMELTFLQLRLGEGKVWGVKNYAGYFKYVPYGKSAHKHVYEALPEARRPEVNSLGFRGKEFTPKPEPGTTRVVTLGDSATFGAHNGETETYPAQLEAYLNQGNTNGSFEVINAGMPMMNIAQMSAFLKNELVNYDPSIVTLYTSYNDVIDSTYQKNFISSLYNFLYKYSEFGVWFTRQIKTVLASDAKKGEKFLPKISAQEVKQSLSQAEDFYFTHLKEIHQTCSERGIRLFIVKQPTAKPQSYLDLETYMKLSQEERDRYYELKLEREGQLNILESKFYIARHLASKIGQFAEANRIPLIDFSKIADSQLDWFVGPVHMNPTGNGALARLISQRIEQDRQIASPTSH